jgi:membrane-bound lytic murein transglycosylase B
MRNTRRVAQRDETGTTVPPTTRLRPAAPPNRGAAPQAPAAPGAAPAPDTARTAWAAPDAAGTVRAAPDAAGGPAEAAGPAEATVATGPAEATVAAAAPGSAPGAAPRRARHSRLGRAPRAVRGWASRPGGRLSLSGLLVLAMLALAGAAGAYGVPRLLDKPAAAPVANPAGPTAAGPVPATPPAQGALPSGAQFPTLGPAQPLPGQERPPDQLAAWAAPIAAKLSIPPVALQAYGYAELMVATSQPQCQLRWSTLAGIGKIESNHGQANATLGVDGRALPPIIGPPLDGTDDRLRVADTDGGQLDGDKTWDRAVGPMQFIPATWQQYQVDADRDGRSDPNDINDAALAAANYLCAGNRDLSTGAGWWSAILSYNAVQRYARDVFTAANDYGQLSRG